MSDKMSSEKCVAGCMVFTGGEIKHDENCIYYSESLTKMYNDIRQQTSTLRKEIEDLTRAYNQCSESHRRSVDSHCIEKELLQKEIEEQHEVIKCKNEIIIGRQKEIEDLKEQNEKFAIDFHLWAYNNCFLRSSHSELWFKKDADRFTDSQLIEMYKQSLKP